MTEVQLDAIQACGNRAPAGFRKTLQHIFDFVLLDLLRRRTARHLAYRNLARPQHVRIVFVRVARRIGLQERCGRSQANMQQLRDDCAVVFFHCPCHTREPFDLVFVPKTRKAGRGVEGVLVDEMPAKNDHADPGLSALFVISDGLLGEDALVRTSHPGGTDRSKDDPIGNLGVADLPWGEQMRIRANTRHGDPPLTFFRFCGPCIPGTVRQYGAIGLYPRWALLRAHRNEADRQRLSPLAV